MKGKYKNFIIVMFSYFLSLILFGCSKNNDEVRAILIDDNVYLRFYVEDLEKVENTQDFVKAIDDYRDTLAKFI